LRREGWRNGEEIEEGLVKKRGLVKEREIKDIFEKE
jgi:hypothetical protein